MTPSGCLKRATVVAAAAVAAAMAVATTASSLTGCVRTHAS